MTTPPLNALLQSFAEGTPKSRREIIAANLASLKAQNAPPAVVLRYLDSIKVTAADELARMPVDTKEWIAGAFRSAYQGASFNFGDEAMAFFRGITEPGTPYAERLADERGALDRFRTASPKTAFGLEMAGGIGSGVGVAANAGRGAMTAANAAPRLLASGIGGGAVAGAGAGEGFTDRAVMAGLGGVGGGVLGAGAARIANSRVGDAAGRAIRNFGDAQVDGGNLIGNLAAEGVDFNALPASTQAALRNIVARSGDEAGDVAGKGAAALAPFEQAGLADDVMPADVLPGGGRELRRTMNVSPQGEEMATTRLTERGAEVGPRVIRNLTEATGLTPQATAEGVEALATARADAARPLYNAALEEGRGKIATPQLRAFLDEPPIQRVVERLRGLREFENVSDESPEMLDAIYKVLSDRHATVKAAQVMDPDNVGRFQQRDLEGMKQRFLSALETPGTVRTPAPPLEVAPSAAPTTREAIEAFNTRRAQAVTRTEGTVAQQSAREALERREAELLRPAVTGEPAPRFTETALPPVMPGYRNAAATFREGSDLKRAYEEGLAMFNKPVGDIKAAMAAMTPDERMLFQRGAFDALVERRVSNAVPSPSLGEAARQSRGAGQVAISNLAAEQRIRAIFGDEAFNRISAAAQGEGKFFNTLAAGTRNSTTAKQLMDMGQFGQMAADAAIGGPGAVVARGAREKFGEAMARAFDEPAARKGADILTQRGAKATRGVLDQVAATQKTVQGRRVKGVAAGSAIAKAMASRSGGGKVDPRVGAEITLGMTPGVGDAMAIRDAVGSAGDAVRAFGEGRYGAAAGNAALTGVNALAAVPIVGIGGDVARTAMKVGKAAQGAPAVRVANAWKPTPRGIFEREGLPDMQGTVPSDPRLTLPEGQRQQSSMIVDAITSSPAVRAGLRGDAERGLAMGGDRWYDMSPLRNYMQSRNTPGAMSFEDWTRIGSGSSMQNSVPSEISAATITAFARKRGIPLDEAKRIFRQQTGTDKLPMLTGMHREVGDKALRNNAVLPENPLGANWKVPMYADKRLGGGGNVTRGAAGSLPALDTHEKRRILQLARKDPQVAQLMREMGVFDADHVPVANASDYRELGQMYIDGAQDMGLPTAGTFQAGRWIGGWKDTGLKSPPSGDYIQILEDAITYSAQRRGMPSDPASLKAYFDRVLAGDDFIVPFTGRGAIPVKPQGR